MYLSQEEARALNTFVEAFEDYDTYDLVGVSGEAYGRLRRRLMEAAAGERRRDASVLLSCVRIARAQGVFRDDGEEPTIMGNRVSAEHFGRLESELVEATR